MRVICDFDGTITLNDTTDCVLEALADPEWIRIEAQWLAREISAAECMRRQIALIRSSDEELDTVLDQVELDPGFPGFVDWCEARAIPLQVVSDGVDRFIRRILARHGLSHLPVVANRLVGRAPKRRLAQPWARSGCAAGSGVCKCAQAQPALKSTLVYVGDGRSDFCVSARADILFAKGELAAYAAERGQRFLPFETFDDVTRELALLAGLPPAIERAAV
jgi:2,3-diketo-5-methylthio-1-phosphopentane phosphatase